MPFFNSSAFFFVDCSKFNLIIQWHQAKKEIQLGRMELQLAIITQECNVSFVKKFITVEYIVTRDI